MVSTTDEAYCFYEDSLPDWNIPYIMLAEDSAGDVFFPVRPLITALGVDRPTQMAIIQEDTRLKGGVRLVKKAPTCGGKQDVHYLRRREVAIWLTLIDPDKVAPRARGRVEEFQAALWQLADRIVFRRRRLAAGGATDTGMLIELHGAQRGEFTCDCGRHHIIEIAEGEMRVYHAEE
jgi:P22_AR N-terminal domain